MQFLTLSPQVTKKVAEAEQNSAAAGGGDDDGSEDDEPVRLWNQSYRNELFFFSPTNLFLILCCQTGTNTCCQTAESSGSIQERQGATQAATWQRAGDGAALYSRLFCSVGKDWPRRGRHLPPAGPACCLYGHLPRLRGPRAVVEEGGGGSGKEFFLNGGSNILSL